MKEWQIFHDGPMPALAAYALGLAALAMLAFCLTRELRRRRAPLLRLLWITRPALALLATLLLARPNALFTSVRIQPGKTVVMVDDSASMFVRDAPADPAEAEGIAALIGLAQGSRISGECAPASEARHAAKAAADLRNAALKAAGDLETGISAGAGETAAIRAAAEALRNASQRIEQTAASPGLGEDCRRAAEQAARETAAVGGGALTLLSAPERRGDAAEWRRLADSCERAVRVLDSLESTASKGAEQGVTAEAHVAQISAMTRYELAWKAASSWPALRNAEILNLARKSDAPLDASEAVAFTDLVSPLSSWLDERPLELINGVVLFTDGCQNLAYDSGRLEVYRRRGVPLVIVGTGGRSERTALEIADIRCPLFGVLRDPAEVVVEIRTDRAAGMPVELLLEAEAGSGSDDAPAQEPQTEHRRPKSTEQKGNNLPWRGTLPAQESGIQIWRVPVRWDAAGRRVLKITASAGGTKTERRVPVHVFDRKPAVLLVAERPDPFAISIIAQRGRGAAVYPLITYGNPANCRRGENRQFLPRSAKEWARYELIVLVGRPFPGFTAEDADGIAGAVREKGVGLVLAGDPQTGYAKALARAFGWAWPSDSTLEAQAGISPDRDAGALPMVRLAEDAVRSMNLWREMAGPSLWRSVPGADFIIVRHDPSGSAVASLNFHGCGRVLLLGLDGWQRMKEWAPEAFDRFAERLVQDMLLRTLPEEGPGAGVYPAMSEPGARSVLIARPAQPFPESMKAVVEDAASGRTAVIDMLRDGGCFRAAHVFSRSGAYSISPDGLPPVVHEVSQPLSAELRGAGPDEQTMRELADAAGGVFVPISRFSRSANVPPLRERQIVETRVVRFQDWRNAVVAMFVLMAAADFVIRKHGGLAV